MRLDYVPFHYINKKALGHFFHSYLVTKLAKVERNVVIMKVLENHLNSDNIMLMLKQ